MSELGAFARRACVSVDEGVRVCCDLGGALLESGHHSRAGRRVLYPVVGRALLLSLQIRVRAEEWGWGGGAGGGGKKSLTVRKLMIALRSHNRLKLQSRGLNFSNGNSNCKANKK